MNKQDVSSVTSIVGMKFTADQKAERGENLFHIFINLHERAPENFFDKYINPYLSIEYDDSDMIREHSSQEILKRVAKIIKPFKNLKSYGKEIYISTINGPKSAKEFEDTIIAIGNKRVRVGDVANVRYGLSRAKEISHFNGNKNISINVTKTKSGNAIYLSKKIRELLS